jgi:hypothetical protein
VRNLRASRSCVPKRERSWRAGWGNVLTGKSQRTPREMPAVSPRFLAESANGGECRRGGRVCRDPGNVELSSRPQSTGGIHGRSRGRLARRNHCRDGCGCTLAESARAGTRLVGRRARDGARFGSFAGQLKVPVAPHDSPRCSSWDATRFCTLSKPQLRARLAVAVQPSPSSRTKCLVDDSLMCITFPADIDYGDSRQTAQQWCNRGEHFS